MPTGHLLPLLKTSFPTLVHSSFLDISLTISPPNFYFVDEYLIGLVNYTSLVNLYLLFVSESGLTLHLNND